MGSICCATEAVKNFSKLLSGEYVGEGNVGKVDEKEGPLMK
jgi:hypothetical protein